MTDPHLPPPTGAVAPQPVYGAVPPVPQAPAGAYQAPPGAYQVPVGGYAVPSGGYAPPAPAAPASRTLGVLALVLSLVAAVVTPIIVGIASYEIGRRVPDAIDYVGSEDSLAFLSPARDQVLWAELSFWTGTLLGLAAIVMGIIAIVKRRGRGPGIGAIVVAGIAPVIFLCVLVVALGMGAAAGFIDSPPSI